MTTLTSLIAIIGPTAVGKTAISIRLTERLDGEVVSADSRLLYRGMDIGTAKPTHEELARVPHHLIDVAEPDDPWSLAVFRHAALEAIEAIHHRGRIPFLVGGTGQYVTAILEGWSPPPKSGDAALRHKLEAFAETHGSQALHKQLIDVDPVTAARIDHRNLRRVVRALEIFHVTGVPLSQQRTAKPPPFRVLRVGLTLPRRELYARIDARIDAMLEAGLVDEVRGLLEDGVSQELPAMSAIGYRQIGDYLRGLITMEEAVQQMRRVTRQFVRRQANWFKADDPRIHWFDASQDVVERIEDLIKTWLEEAGDPQIKVVEG